MKKTLLILTGVASLLAVGATYVNWIGTAYATFERPAFNDLDKTRLYKTYRKMHIDIATGKFDIGDFDPDNEDDLVRMDEELIRRYHASAR
jgi:hypothetical protein